MKERLLQELEQIKEAGNYREIRYLKPVNASRVRYEGREYLNLCSNSYLSLHLHPDVIRAAKDATDEYGAGTCSSRSVSGSIDLYARLEDEVASFKGYEKALIFSNGYLANIGIIATLAGARDVIFSDELNHSSIIDSTRLSGAHRVIYRHLDVEDLEKKIRRESARTKTSKKFIITETVFSMDGDIAPLGPLWELCRRHDGLLYIDDAHATGVIGSGKGALAHFGISLEPRIVQMGTFSKALGSYGAFVAGSREVIDWLTSTARTFMFSTALPACVMAASLKALGLIEAGHDSYRRLWTNHRRLLQGLAEISGKIGSCLCASSDAGSPSEVN